MVCKLYLNGILSATLEMNKVTSQYASRFVIIDRLSFRYIRNDDEYIDEMVFKTTIDGVSYEDTYTVRKTTTYTDTDPSEIVNNVPSIGFLINWLYPIGSIYTSMNNINPSTFIGGTWEQIVDRFLYCANSSMETGGSKKITVEQLPAHSHSITELDIRGNEDGSNQYTIAKYGGNDTTIKTGNTGNGEDYMPPYMTVFAWYRTA